MKLDMRLLLIAAILPFTFSSQGLGQLILAKGQVCQIYNGNAGGPGDNQVSCLFTVTPEEFLEKRNWLKTKKIDHVEYDGMELLTVSSYKVIAKSPNNIKIAIIGRSNVNERYINMLIEKELVFALLFESMQKSDAVISKNNREKNSGESRQEANSRNAKTKVANSPITKPASRIPPARIKTTTLDRRDGRDPQARPLRQPKARQPIASPTPPKSSSTISNKLRSAANAGNNTRNNAITVDFKDHTNNANSYRSTRATKLTASQNTQFNSFDDTLSATSDSYSRSHSLNRAYNDLTVNEPVNKKNRKKSRRGVKTINNGKFQSIEISY